MHAERTLLHAMSLAQPGVQEANQADLASHELVVHMHETKPNAPLSVWSRGTAELVGIEVFGPVVSWSMRPPAGLLGCLPDACPAGCCSQVRLTGGENV